MSADTVDAQALNATVWIPVAEAARRMKPPVSRAAMSKRVRKFEGDGALETRPGPRGTKLVNIVVLDRLVGTETDPSQALRNGEQPGLPLDEDDGDTETPSAAGQSAGAQAPSGFHAARAERESYQAENARLDLEERLSRLLDADETERRVLSIMRRTRDRLLSLPAILFPEDFEGRDLAKKEIRRILDGLAQDFEHMADAEADDGDVEDEPDAREPAETSA